MQVNQNSTTPSSIPFALMGHIPSHLDDEKLLGDASQEWSWEPIGDLKKENLAVYASGGNSTTRQSGYNQWDSGEYQ